MGQLPLKEQRNIAWTNQIEVDYSNNATVLPTSKPKIKTTKCTSNAQTEQNKWEWKAIKFWVSKHAFCIVPTIVLMT